jgi:hypothetical protein
MAALFRVTASCLSLETMAQAPAHSDAVKGRDHQAVQHRLGIAPTVAAYESRWDQ